MTILHHLIKHPKAWLWLKEHYKNATNKPFLTRTELEPSSSCEPLSDEALRAL